MINLGDKEKLKSYLLKKSVRIGDCLRFTGKHENGYGAITIDSRKWGVHRLSAYIFHDLDLSNPSLMALHKTECKFKDCWDEHHIYVGTQSDNIKDAVTTKTHFNAGKTHCPAGHPYDSENTRIRLGRRLCRACDKVRYKAKYERNKRLEVARKSRQHEP